MSDLGAIKDDLAADWARLGPFTTCERLALTFRKEGRTAFICCPWHADKAPSCTVAIGQAGTIRVHCFSCAQTWDIHSLVAQLDRIDLRGSDFARVLVREAELLGRWDLVGQLEDKPCSCPGCKADLGCYRDRKPPAPAPAPTPQAERQYPPGDEIESLWDACRGVHLDREVSTWLRGRGLRVYELCVRDLVRALPVDVQLPAWARKRDPDGTPRTWIELGHRLITPLFDAAGIMRSVRARYVGTATDHFPKSLTPAGFKAAGLVMADPFARLVLEHGAVPPDWFNARPFRLVVTEGEPDWLTWSLQVHQKRHAPLWGVIGLESGGWTPEFAARVPDGAKVSVWTHSDVAGERYASKIVETLSPRCTVVRGGVQG